MHHQIGNKNEKLIFFQGFHLDVKSKICQRNYMAASQENYVADSTYLYVRNKNQNDWVGIHRTRSH